MNAFWRHIPWLAPAEIRDRAAPEDYIPVHFLPSANPTRDAYAGGGAGAPHHTDLQRRLNDIQAVQIADLETMLKSRAKVVALRNLAKHREDASPSLAETLAPVKEGPTSTNTLLRKGRKIAKARDAATDPSYRGYLPTIKARLLEQAGDIPGLDDMIERQVLDIALMGHALLAAEAVSNGMRELFNRANKGHRPTDETIAALVIDSAKPMTIAEMTEFAMACGALPSRIWLQYHGDPDKIDYHRLFELAVLAGQLERGEPAELRCDIARFFLNEWHLPSAEDVDQIIEWPNLIEVGFALMPIYATIHAAYGIRAFWEEAINCYPSGESRILRVKPIPG